MEYVKTKTDPIILFGKTICGQKFRPSDWAQRLTVAVSSVGPKKKIISHPRVHMAIKEGLPAVVIDPILEQENKMMFDFLLNFGKSNKLFIQIPGESEEPEEAKVIS